MQTLTINTNRRGLTAVVFSLAVSFIFVGQAFALGLQCTSPYVQVQNGAAAFFPDPTNQFSIQSVSVGEPFVSCNTKQITFVLKVPTMDPGNTGMVTAPPQGAWQVRFLVPGNKNSSGSNKIVYVQWTTPGNAPTGQFSYGFLNPADSSEVFYSTPTPVTGTVNPNGTFTFNLNIGNTLTFTAATGGTVPTWSIDPSDWGTFPLNQIQGVTRRSLQPGVLIFQPFDDALTAGDGVYNLLGNVACSNPPVAALVAAPTSGNAPLTVNFDASTSNIPAGGCGTIASYTFNFGDGTQITQSTPTISHTYSTGGVTYPARVTVTSTVGVISGFAQQNITVNPSGPPQLVSVVSRMTHGGALDHDIDLPQPPAARVTECRSHGGNYKLVLTFLNNLVSVASTSLTTGTGSILNSGLGPNTNQYTVNLTGVTDIQTLTVTLNTAVDTSGASGNVPVILPLLIGDVNGNGRVTNGDVSSVQAQVGAAVDASNFRNDINANGTLSNGDVAAAQAKVGGQLP